VPTCHVTEVIVRFGELAVPTRFWVGTAFVYAVVDGDVIVTVGKSDVSNILKLKLER
jgi:hypothetical protein